MPPVKKFTAASKLIGNIQSIVIIAFLKFKPECVPAHYCPHQLPSMNFDFSLAVYVDKMTQTGNVLTQLKNSQFDR